MRLFLKRDRSTQFIKKYIFDTVIWDMQRYLNQFLSKLEKVKIYKTKGFTFSFEFLICHICSSNCTGDSLKTDCIQNENLENTNIGDIKSDNSKIT